jgi:HAD superfamily phosphoserine phosphatase-like hydrolase
MIKLVISDFDGTIVQLHGIYQSSWDSVGNLLESDKRKKWFESRDKYLDSISKTKSTTEKNKIEKIWFNSDLSLMKGSRVDYFLKNIEMNYTPGAQNFFEESKKQGKIIGILSSGIDFIIEKVAKELNFDFFLCSQVFHSKGIINGKGKEVVTLQNKLVWFKKIREKYQVKPKEVVYLGDHFNCVPCLKEAGLGIAINAKTEEVKKAAKYSLRDFNGVLELIKNYDAQTHQKSENFY